MGRYVVAMFSSLAVLLCVLVVPVIAQDEHRQPDHKKSLPSLPVADFPNVSYGNHPHQKLDLWLAKSDKPTPLVINFHGGGFAVHTGTRHSLKKPLLDACLKAGISVATADYRYTKDATLPIPMHDAGRAIQFLRYHATKYNLDARKAAAHGGSGGGGISLWLAYHDDLAHPSSDDPIARQSSRIVCAAVRGAQTSYDPRLIEKLFSERNLWEDREVLDRLYRFYGLTEDEIKSEKAHKLYDEAAPLTHVSADDPPVFMFYGQPDCPITQKTPRPVWVHHPRFAEPLKQKTQPLGLELIVKLGSDYDKKSDSKRRQEAVTADMVAFFQRHFDAVGRGCSAATRSSIRSP